jgi:molecular chaperone DnaK
MATIQIGIDLGTTNSAIAVNHAGKIEIIKNFDRDEFTPSVF